VYTATDYLQDIDPPDSSEPSSASDPAPKANNQTVDTVAQLDVDILQSVIAQLRAIEEEEILSRLTSPRVSPPHSPPSALNPRILHNQNASTSNEFDITCLSDMLDLNSNEYCDPTSSHTQDGEVSQTAKMKRKTISASPYHSPPHSPTRQSENDEASDGPCTNIGRMFVLLRLSHQTRSGYEFSGVVLGKGAYSTVFQGRCLDTKRRVAVKVIPFERTPVSNFQVLVNTFSLVISKSSF
jgi:hypothetical protein